MNIPHYKKLSFQLIAALAGSFIIIILSSYLYIYGRISDTLKQNNDISNIQSFKQFEYNIENFCNEVDLLSRRLVSDTSLTELIYPQNSKNQIVLIAELFRKMNQELEEYGYLESIAFYNEEDLTLISTSTQNIIYNDKKSRDGFYKNEIETIQNNKFSGTQWFGGYDNYDFRILPLNSSLNKKDSTTPYLTACYPVYWGLHTGLIIYNINIDYFTSIYNSAAADRAQTGNTYIINEEGTIVSHQDMEQLGKKKGMEYLRPNKTEPYTFDKMSNQILGYPLAMANWTIINETPLSVILKDTHYIQTLIRIVLLAGISLTLLFSVFWVSRIIKPLTQVVKVMKRMEKGNIGITIPHKKNYGNEFDILIYRFNKMSQSMEQLIHDNKEIEDKKRVMEINFLKSQINPHFLYNTLNTIKWMAVIQKNDSIVDCVAILADLLHPVFRDKNIYWSIEDELSYLNNYTKIMNYRYGNKIAIIREIPKELNHTSIPKFILQPIVENSITHGLSGTQGGQIYIKAEIIDRHLRITVSDNGIGINQEELIKIQTMLLENQVTQHIGIQNVHQRLRLLGGEEAGVKVQADDNGKFVISLTMSQGV